MRDVGPNMLQQTLLGLEIGLHVWHIATTVPDLRTCRTDDDPETVRRLMDFYRFDQMPVRDEGGVVGVVTLSALAACGDIRTALEPLKEELLVAAETPVERYVDIAAKSHFRLVVRDARVQGIVTRSDLQALPVRIFVFTLITHLELTLARAIRARCPGDQWMSKLSPGRQCKVQCKIERYRGSKMDADPLEFTDFCDKREIVRKIYGLDGSFAADLVAVEKLRNAVAHAGTYASSAPELEEFARQLKSTRDWIETLEQLIEEPPEASG